MSVDSAEIVVGACTDKSRPELAKKLGAEHILNVDDEKGEDL